MNETQIPTEHPDDETRLLARLTADFSARLQAWTTERDAHPVGSPEWFIQEERANTLTNLLHDMEHTLEHGVTRLEYQRYVATRRRPEPVGLLERLTTEVTGQVERRTAERNRARKHSKARLYLGIETETLTGLLGDLQATLSTLGTTSPETETTP